MSRKWERMVEKNKKRMNQTRTKTGQAVIGTKEAHAPIRGRSWVFPLALLTAGALFGMTMPQDEGNNTLYQITVGLYILLALFHFWVRRPFLKIDKKGLTWRTYAGERTVEPDQIAEIAIGARRSTVRLKDGKTKRTFSGLYHLYKMHRVNEALTTFAAAHHIPIETTKKGA